MTDSNSNSEKGDEPLTPYQKHAAKFQKPSPNSENPEQVTPKAVIPKGMLDTCDNPV